MTPPHVDKTKTCEFHRNRGHTTEECTALQDRIEDLVKSGHLQNFTQPSSKKKHDSYHDNRRGNPRRRHLRAVISVNTVTRGGLIHMPPITFTNKDFQGVDPVQDDPMVINVEINNCIVKKKLVDQGSSADILYWKTFEQLGIPERELAPYNEPLVGFSGERVDTRGTIDLYTYFGDEQ
uniref:Retrotransposon gag domain-containing protein n=1 Tax=Cajanus cajan TaxID=3821 RepID=A0A151UAA3_CAJCA|nr:hypothetical protein KK1_020478 [Cajanus cajan]